MHILLDLDLESKLLRILMQANEIHEKLRNSTNSAVVVVAVWNLTLTLLAGISAVLGAYHNDAHVWHVEAIRHWHRPETYRSTVRQNCMHAALALGEVR